MKRRTKRIQALLLATIMVIACFAGCGKINGDNGVGSVNGTDGLFSENAGGSSADSQGGDIVRGRYVEEVADLSDRIFGSVTRINRLSDGRLVITDTDTPFLISDDNGMTWEYDYSEWLMKMFEETTYIMHMAVGNDNTAAVIFNDDSSAGEDEYCYNPRLLVVRPDGTEQLIDIPLTGNDKYLENVGIADDGRIFVSVIGSSNLYEVKEDGSCKYFMTVQGERPELMQFQGKLMFLDGLGYESPLIYDMEKEEYVEDEVLADFIRENYPDGNAYNESDAYQMFFFTGEEGVLYIAGKKGLHRHVIGGSAMEQVIDGSLCTFSNPAYEICGMIMLENNEFLTLFSGGRLVRYVYDPGVAAVPGNKLKVYSLKENDTIRQAIALYQTNHPDIAVEYEIGMEEGSSATREDAIKNLNTKIMAGEGPDVLLLDDMPLDSYMEKGLLMDLSVIIGGFSGEDEIFTNIAEAMEKDDKVYAIPCEIQIPVMMGEKKYISQIKDLESMADVMEELRDDNPGKDLLYICTEKGIMRYFAMSCVPAWTTESGDFDRKAIEEFLTQTKRIYDAQMEGLPAEIVERYKKSDEFRMWEFGELKDESKYTKSGSSAINYAEGSTQLAYALLDRPFLYDELLSINKVEGVEETDWTVLTGQSSHVFCAKTLLGINAASKNTDLAEDFIRLCLGKKNQSNLFYGLAVNKAAFEENFIVDESVKDEDGGYVWMWTDSEDDIDSGFTVYQSNEEQIAVLRKCIETADTPYIEDTVLENVVYEEGIRYMQGTQSLEEAVNAIEKKISIYLAE